jgi:hypothetical protein
MSVSAPISSFQIPVSEPVEAWQGRAAGLLARFAAWLRTAKPSVASDELTQVNNQLLAALDFRSDARPYSRRLPVHADAVRGAIRGQFYL